MLVRNLSHISPLSMAFLARLTESGSCSVDRIKAGVLTQLLLFGLVEYVPSDTNRRVRATTRGRDIVEARTVIVTRSGLAPRTRGGEDDGAAPAWHPPAPAALTELVTTT